MKERRAKGTQRGGGDKENEETESDGETEIDRATESDDVLRDGETEPVVANCCLII